ncbi:MAG: NADH-quinone oxidoreductase subunit J [Thermaerobacter sp.]|nr:NADH-quinone oxidoreductase subunit J [Thermaerobacter sp.]
MVGFVILAILAMAGAVGVIVARQPVHSALFLIGNIIALAVLYLTLSAEFLAAAQVIVYAGAIMVLFLFVVTLLTAGKDEREAAETLPGQRLIAGGASGLVGLALVVLAILNPGPAISLGLPKNFGTLRGMGAALWGPDFVYLVAVAIMLLTAAIGVLVLNRPERRAVRGARKASARQTRSREGQA